MHERGFAGLRRRLEPAKFKSKFKFYIRASIGPSPIVLRATVALKSVLLCVPT